MPRNGSGTYAPPAGQPVVGGTTIDSAVFNALVADLGTEFTRSVSTDGQSPMGANLPMGGFKITGMAAGTLATDAARVDQLGGPASTLRTDLAANTGSSLSGHIHSGVGAVDRTVQEKLRDVRNVNDFFIAAEANASAMFNRASVNAGIGGTIVVPGQAFVLGDEVTILDYQTWQFEGASFTHSDDTKTMFRANTKTGFSLLGRWYLTGLLVTAATTAECGLYITDCKRYRVEGLTAKTFKGKGIFLDGSGPGGLRGDRGQFTDCSAHECTVGVKISNGAGGEYNTWGNTTCSGNVTGIQVDAGNNTFMGGCSVDNSVGVQVLGVGVNNAHGMFIGMNINHNTSLNIHCLNVTNGQTFVGCHAYGNGIAFTSQGALYFENSKGCVFSDGVIDAWIYNDSGAGSGMNYILRNYFPTGITNTDLKTNNVALHQLTVLGNFDSAGQSVLNNPAAVFVGANRATSTLAIAGTTTVVWNNEELDTRLSHDASTGIFTAPTAGWYRYTTSVTVTGTSLTAGYGTFLKNGAAIAYAPCGLVSSTIMIIAGSMEFKLAAGDTLAFGVNATGTSPVVAITTSRMSVALIN